MTAQPLHLDEAEDYLGRVISALHAMAPERKGPLVAVLDFLLGHIRRTRTDLNTLRMAPGEPSLATAADELEEIVQETATATNAIMDAAEAIERIAANASPQIRDALRGETTKIYEASAFQDITGQRITKALRALQTMEQQISVLVQGCGGEELLAGSEAVAVSDDHTLMNGPQLSSHANSQDEIDRLLASLGS